MRTDRLAAGRVRRVRWVGNIEGVSYLLLLGVAMPLKYAAGIFVAVKIVGWAHGVLFVLLGLLALRAVLTKSLSWGEAILVGIASLLPFGPFVVDRRLRRAEQRAHG